MNLKNKLYLSLITLASPAFSYACDLCSIYNAVEAGRPTASTIRVGVAEQYSNYGKLQDGGKFIENTENQHMNSSITQVYGAYDLSDSTSFQVNLPYISRRFKRVHDGVIDNGTEAGIGDMTFIGKYIPYQDRTEEHAIYLQGFAGIKLPTGDSDRIGEELEEGHHDTEHDAAGTAEDGVESAAAGHLRILQSALKHNGTNHGEGEEAAPESIHGHDLALGTGSYDFPIGLNFFAQSGKAFISTTVQYTFRTEGDFDYRYANDLMWETGPAYFVLLNHNYTVALKANLSGEYKRQDELDGDKQGDTGVQTTFLGPEVLFTAGSWAGELAWDVPLDVNNSGIQAVVDNKVRAALTYRF